MDRPTKVVLHITPVPKPRMTKADAWKKRPVVLRYWQYADDLRELAADNGLYLPDCGTCIRFVLPMPKSWPKWKKGKLDGQPHKQKPDTANLLKAVEDILRPGGDEAIWHYGALEKRWGKEGKIEFVLSHMVSDVFG